MEISYDFISRYSYLKKNIYNILGPFLDKKALLEQTKRVFDYIDITDTELIISVLSILFDKGRLVELRGYKYIEELKSNNEYMNRVNDSMPIFRDKMKKGVQDGERDFFAKYFSQMNPEFVMSFMKICEDDNQITEEQFVMDLFRYLHIFTSNNLVLETKGRAIIEFYSKIARITGKTNDEMCYILSDSELKYLLSNDRNAFLKGIPLAFDLEYIIDVASEIEKWDINDVKKLVK